MSKRDLIGCQKLSRVVEDFAPRACMVEVIREDFMHLAEQVGKYNGANEHKEDRDQPLLMVAGSHVTKAHSGKMVLT
jgi:hypothetical protein